MRALLFHILAVATHALRQGHETLDVLGRETLVYRPETAQKFSVPAIMVLHGSEQEAKDMFDVGLEQQADLNGFIVVYPEMSKPFSDDWGFNEDIGYFSKLASRLQESDFGLDPSQLFVCGHSAGGTMVTFLQNEMDVFAAAGVVEAAVGHLGEWDLTKRGSRTMVIWNHADPVLEWYAPEGGEPAYYNLTLNTLRRDASTVPAATKPLDLSEAVTQAEVLTFEEEPASPELKILSWTSAPGRHTWADKSWTGTIDASEQLVAFFFRRDVQIIV